MSCFISSAVCCALVTASLSGIALGYNYSLAEYIDLKETNVSVYLKRGIFDDEIVDDMEWRRSGHLPVAGHIGEGNLRTGGPDQEEMPLRSGRRLDDSVLESDDHNKFEGSLMKLTAKPIDHTVTTTALTPDVQMAEVIQKFPDGSLDQMKAIHSLINRRKFNQGLTTSGQLQQSTAASVNSKDMPPYGPGFLGPLSGLGPNSNANPSDGRRIMPYDRSVYKYMHPARLAVPDRDINNPAYWKNPKLPPDHFPANYYDDMGNVRRATYPKPITLSLGPIRPTTTPMPKPPPTHTTYIPITEFPKMEDDSFRRLGPDSKSDEEAQKFKDNMLLGKDDSPSYKAQDFLKMDKSMARSDDEDYDVDAKGVPVRKRRDDAPFKKNLETPNVLAKVQPTADNKYQKSVLIDRLINIYNKLISSDSSETQQKV